MGLIRIDDHFHSALKKQSRADGRTLEWTVNRILGDYLDTMTDAKHVGLKPPKVVPKPIVYEDEPPTDWDNPEHGKHDEVTIKEAEKVVDAMWARKKEQNVCKVHGTPLTNSGKCLQKGCKHA